MQTGSVMLFVASPPATSGCFMLIWPQTGDFSVEVRSGLLDNTAAKRTPNKGRRRGCCSQGERVKVPRGKW